MEEEKQNISSHCNFLPLRTDCFHSSWTQNSRIVIFMNCFVPYQSYLNGKRNWDNGVWLGPGNHSSNPVLCHLHWTLYSDAHRRWLCREQCQAMPPILLPRGLSSVLHTEPRELDWTSLVMLLVCEGLRCEGESRLSTSAWALHFTGAVLRRGEPLMQWVQLSPTPVNLLTPSPRRCSTGRCRVERGRRSGQGVHVIASWD